MLLCPPRYLLLSLRYYHFNFILSRATSRVLFLSPRDFEYSTMEIFNVKNSIRSHVPHIRRELYRRRSRRSPVFNLLMDPALDAGGNHQFRPAPPYLIKSYLSRRADRRRCIDVGRRRREGGGKCTCPWVKNETGNTTFVVVHVARARVCETCERSDGYWMHTDAHV